MHNQVGVGYDSHEIRVNQKTLLGKARAAELAQSPNMGFSVLIPEHILAAVLDIDRFSEVTEKTPLETAIWNSDSDNFRIPKEKVYEVTQEELSIQEIMNLAHRLARSNESVWPYTAHELIVQSITLTNFIICNILEAAVSRYTSTDETPSCLFTLMKSFQANMEGLGYPVSLILFDELVKIDPAVGYLYAVETEGMEAFSRMFTPDGQKNGSYWNVWMNSLECIKPVDGFQLYQLSSIPLSMDLMISLQNRFLGTFLVTNNDRLNDMQKTELIENAMRFDLDVAIIPPLQENFTDGEYFLSEIDGHIIDALVYRHRMTKARESFLIYSMFLFGDIRYLDKLIKSLYVFVNAYSTSINTADLRFSANTQTPGNEPTTSLVPFNPSKEFLVSFLSSLQAHLKIVLSQPKNSLKKKLHFINL